MALWEPAFPGSFPEENKIQATIRRQLDDP